MGDVIPFRPKARSASMSPAVRDADLHAIATVAIQGDRCAVLRAATPLLHRLSRDRGIAVMRDGLPSDALVLARALINLDRALSRLAGRLGEARRFGGFGVYFGRDTIHWFEDGYGGETALGLPDDFDGEALAAFIEARLTSRRAKNSV